MAVVLKNIVIDREEIPEGYDEAYLEGKDGDGNIVFQLQTEDNIGLKTALDRERGNASKLDTQLKGFRDANVTVERFKEMTSELKVLHDKNVKGEGDMESLKAEMVARYDTTLSEKETRIKVLMKALHERVVGAEATTAIVGEKGDPELLSPHVTKNLRMEEPTDGRFVAIVVDEGGSKRAGDTHGNPMTAAQLVKEMKEKTTFAPAFEGHKMKGTDLNPLKGKGGIDLTNLPDEPMARIAAVRKQEAESAKE